MNGVRLFSLFLFCSAALTALPAVQGYALGVTSGQFATYSYSNSSTSVPANVAGIKFQIRNMTQLNVTFQDYYVYVNGSQKNWANNTIDTRVCYVPFYNSLLVSNLHAGDSICDYQQNLLGQYSPYNAKINQTVTYHVGGTIRNANLFDLVSSSVSNPASLTEIWDRQTGLLLYYALVTSTEYFALQLISTNAFPTTSAPVWTAEYFAIGSLALAFSRLIIKRRATIQTGER